jgi:putative RNA 2'-phosphotransferase
VNTKKISHKMSYILRHKPESIGATLDLQGWLDTPLLLEALNIPMDQLELVVDTCDKKRYEFNEDHSKIRASQGHSVKVELGYKPMEPPAELYHGTVDKVIQAITKSGLQKMNRHHVHLSVDIETASKVGSRRGKPIILKVDAELMHKAGHKFFVSTNGVWLTEEVPPRYISLSHD